MQISSEEYEELKPLLFSIGYRMLGSIQETEDAVQETFMRAHEVDQSNINNKKAFVCKIMTNRCLDLLKSARLKREQYVGPWNPEPIFNEKQTEGNPVNLILRKEGLTIAYLRMMENLSPVERAVLVLREIFDISYLEISEIVDKSLVNCRKIYSRAQEKLKKVSNESLDYNNNKQVVDQFIQALQLQNQQQLLQLLSANITLYSDGGGKVLAALRPIPTKQKVSAFLYGLVRKLDDNYIYKITSVNGQPAIVIYMNGRLQSIISFFIIDDIIQEIYITLNPDKL
ncbi:RNA polymerase sigma-70 factor, ECF subfamily [Oceanobacillus limi]|uniref:RNA polymerase sigma-70 factor, ECF subfamily n=1 Tax=Oceanobacillus limi TaxID=930131 RepID=A0A1I0HL78_9BACI|nr:RNA polymerase sigma-70 factor [Oceanobacillus limi]SET84645.1 RNA polymerase sigma-70 factor, ECF subfamily [Oceanobacillus limi]